MSKESNTNISKYNHMSTTQLEKILNAYPNASDLQVDDILYILEIIVKREKENPEGFADVDSAWQTFQEKHYPYTDWDKQADTPIVGSDAKVSIKKGTRRFIKRVASITLVLVALFLTANLTVSALGGNLWGTVVSWTEDIFGFLHEDSSPENNIKGIDDNQFQFSDLQDALSHYVISEHLVPTWFPEDYTFSGVDVFDTPQRVTFSAVYSKGAEEIVINIIRHRNTGNTYEKDDDNDVEVYVSNSTEHYIMTNIDKRVIVWVVSEFECSVTGNLTLEETKKMIDSIYERSP